VVTPRPARRDNRDHQDDHVQPAPQPSGGGSDESDHGGSGGGDHSGDGRPAPGDD
jgi:hypothetical protein